MFSTKSQLVQRSNRTTKKNKAVGKFVSTHLPSKANVCMSTNPWVNQFEPSDELLTVKDVADRLKCTVAEVYSLTRRRRANRGLLPLPHRKIGRKLYFVWHDVVTWMNVQPGFELPAMERSATSERVI